MGRLHPWIGLVGSRNLDQCPSWRRMNEFAVTYVQAYSAYRPTYILLELQLSRISAAQCANNMLSEWLTGGRGLTRSCQEAQGDVEPLAYEVSRPTIHHLLPVPPATALLLAAGRCGMAWPPTQLITDAAIRQLDKS